MKEITFFYEDLITYYSSKISSLYIESVKGNEYATLNMAIIYKVILRRIVWYYKNVLDDYSIIGIKFWKDKENNFRQFLVTDNNVLIEIKIEGLSSIIGLLISEQDLKKGYFVTWESISK